VAGGEDRVGAARESARGLAVHAPASTCVDAGGELLRLKIERELYSR